MLLTPLLGVGPSRRALLICWGLAYGGVSVSLQAFMGAAVLLAALALGDASPIER